MIKKVNNSFTNLGYLIEVPLGQFIGRQDVIQSSVRHLAGPSSIFFPKGGSGATLQLQAFITSTSIMEFIRTNKELYRLSSLFGRQGVYSQL